MNFEARDIDKSKLPTNRNIIEYFLYLKKTGTATIDKNKKLSSYLQAVFNVITELWKCRNIPLCGKTTTTKLLQNVLNDRREIVKIRHKKKSSEMEYIISNFEV